MLDFKAKMHQIRFPLGLRSPRLMAIFMGPTSKGREWEGEGKGWKWKGWERGGKGRGEEEREEGKRREGGKRRGSSHAFCFSNLGSSTWLEKSRLRHNTSSSFRQILTDCGSTFTAKLFGKFEIRRCDKSHHCVTTLPCKIVMSEK